jgi:hypothetical protein
VAIRTTPLSVVLPVSITVCSVALLVLVLLPSWP